MPENRVPAFKGRPRMDGLRFSVYNGLYPIPAVGYVTGRDLNQECNGRHHLSHFARRCAEAFA